MKEWCIYGLYDPRLPLCLLNIRYVGKTSVPLKTRLSRHIKPSRLKENNHKNCWIRSLLADGIKPSIVELQKNIDGWDWRIIEQQMIYCLRSLGADLTNGTPGGDGGDTWSGRKHTDEEKRKISLAHKGKRKSAEHIANISIAKKGHKLSEEHKRKIGLASKNRPHFPNGGGWKLSKETKAKMSIARYKWWDIKLIKMQIISNPT